MRFVFGIVLLWAVIGVAEVRDSNVAWNTLSRALQHPTSAKGLEAALKAEAPAVMKQISSDAPNAFLRNLWGLSTNFDDRAKDVIVKPEILDVLLSKFGAEARRDLQVHAGLQHTYGYLFSTLETSFGFKRERWTRGDVAIGLGLPKDLLGPEPKSGTLFANATYVMARIAFREDKKRLAALEAASSKVPKAVKALPYTNLKLRRLIETLPDGISLHTDVVEFHRPVPESSNTHWLIYSAKGLLITAFPVDAEFVQKLFEPASLGENKPIRTRYNAFVAGVTDAAQLLSGRRAED